MGVFNGTVCTAAHEKILNPVNTGTSLEGTCIFIGEHALFFRNSHAGIGNASFSRET